MKALMAFLSWHRNDDLVNCSIYKSRKNLRRRSFVRFYIKSNHSIKLEWVWFLTLNKQQIIETVSVIDFSEWTYVCLSSFVKSKINRKCNFDCCFVLDHFALMSLLQTSHKLIKLGFNWIRQKNKRISKKCDECNLNTVDRVKFDWHSVHVDCVFFFFIEICRFYIIEHEKLTALKANFISHALNLLRPMTITKPIFLLLFSAVERQRVC